MAKNNPPTGYSIGTPGKDSMNPISNVIKNSLKINSFILFSKVINNEW